MLNNKKILFAGWGAENKSDFYAYQMWGYLLKKIFPKMISFDTKENYFRYGKEAMNKNFLRIIEKEKPDCVIMIFFNDEFYLETLDKLNKISPDIKRVLISCDEDLKYDNFYKFMSLFFDLKLISQKQVFSKYQKDNLKNLFFHMDFNTYGLKPLSIKKRYDVTFIGRPKADRAEIMEFLANNNINIALFGWEWNNYPKLKKFYKGFLNAEDYNQIINESKINLCLTKAGYKEEKGLYNLKAKAFEVAQTSSFQLIEYFPALLEFFEKDKEVGTFRTKEELLKKVKYYLKNEKIREKIAENSHKKVIREFNREKHLKKIFTDFFTKNYPKQSLPEINKKIIYLSKKEINLDGNKLKEKIKDYDYICFKNNAKISKYRDYIQSYSLEKSEAKISCSDYYVYSRKLKEYMLFRGDWAFRRTGEEFYNLLDISQLMVTKNYFLENIKSFKNFFKNKKFNLMNKENTIFISIPLIQIKKLRTISYENMKKAFEMRFIDRLFSATYQKRLVLSRYPYQLIIASLLGKPFILRYLTESIFNKNNWDKLILNKKYIGKLFSRLT